MRSLRLNAAAMRRFARTAAAPARWRCAPARLPAASREGAVKVVVIGGAAQARAIPAHGPLAAPRRGAARRMSRRAWSGSTPAGKIVAGLAERWNVSDDGLSYIFRLAAASGPTAARSPRSRSRGCSSASSRRAARTRSRTRSARSSDIVAMTDRVIEIRLIAPRPNLLPLLAQPEFAILRDGRRHRPVRIASRPATATALRLTREISSRRRRGRRAARGRAARAAARAERAIARLRRRQADLVLGGTLRRSSARASAPSCRAAAFASIPASGLFGLVPVRAGGALDDPDAAPAAEPGDRPRRADRGAGRARPRAARDPARARARRHADAGRAGMVGNAARRSPCRRFAAAGRPAVRRTSKPTIRIALPDGPGADLLFRGLTLDWGALGFTVERADEPGRRRFRARSTRSRRRPRRPGSCAGSAAASVPVCDPTCRRAARRRAATRRSRPSATPCSPRPPRMIDEHNCSSRSPRRSAGRWCRRASGFAGNRFARHTLTDLEQKPSAETDDGNLDQTTSRPSRLGTRPAIGSPARRSDGAAARAAVRHPRASSSRSGST